MPVCGWTHPAGCAPLSSSRKPDPAQVSGRPLSDALLTQSLLFCLDYFLGSSPDSGVGNQAMEKITEALEEPHTRSNVRQITEEAERSGSCFLSLGLERWCRVLLLSGGRGGSPELLPSTRCGWLSVTCNSSFRGSNALLRLSRSCVHIT